MNIQQTGMVNTQVELPEQIPKVVVIEDRSEVHHLSNSFRVFEFISFECSDHTLCQHLESFLLLWFFLSHLNPVACSRVQNGIRLIRRSQESQTASELGCIIEVR